MIRINKVIKGWYVLPCENCDTTDSTKNVMKNSFTLFGNSATIRFQTVDSWNAIAGDTTRNPSVIKPKLLVGAPSPTRYPPMNPNTLDNRFLKK